MPMTQPSGNAQMDFVETCSPLAISASTVAANRTTYIRIRVAKTITVSAMSIYVGVSAGNVDLGIFTSDGTTLTKIASTGAVATSGTAVVQTINLTASVTLVPGVDYWFALVTSDGVTLTIGRMSPVSSSLGGYKNRCLNIVAGSIPLPATQALSGLSAVSLYWWIAAQ